MKHDDCKYMSTSGRDSEYWKQRMQGFCQHTNVWGFVCHEFCDFECMFYRQKGADE